MSIVTSEQIDLLLSRVRRPSRYINGEVNSVHKDWASAGTKWCLAFPDTYEVGMSHIGLEIIYHILNSESGVFADRVFTPWLDMEAAMREDKIALWGLGSKRSLAEFDVIGFTLPYELTYTNILTMLDLAGIPFLAKDRGEEHPYIIGGGVGAFNPEPVADIFDAVILGDGEDAVLKVNELLKEKGKKKKEDILEELSKIRGVYVPSIHGPASKVFKAVVSDINKATYPTRPIVPFMKAIHDRVGIEIQRGCARGCRFCQAGYIYRPVRQRSPEKIREMSLCQLGASGNEDLSFLSLSAGDYEQLPQLIKSVADATGDDFTNISLPSLRVESLTPELLSALKRTLMGGFTLAPEAATERLRRVINKGNTEEDLLTTIDKVFAIGWRALKLYFMIGLPTEKMEDVQAIVDLSNRAYNIGRRYRRDITITVSISTFVPKPHTPFQWAGQISIEETKKRQDFLKNQLRRRGIELKWHDPRLSFLEGVFSRGDRKLLPVVIDAWKNGARLDAWDDAIKFDAWMNAFQNVGIVPEEYLKERGVGEELPWDHLFADLDREFLKREYELALKGEPTQDCIGGKCTKCGICDFKDIKNIVCHPESADSGRSASMNTGRSFANAQDDTKASFVFSKTGALRWLSHLELVMVFRRAFRRAGIPVKYSQGFHPHMKLSLERALKVGEEAVSEKGKIEFAGKVNAEELMEKINAQLPDGIKITAFLF